MYRMDYPDGTIHNVEFKEFIPIKISGRSCYVAIYFDHTLNIEMITLITQENGVWYKIPLDGASYKLLASEIKNPKRKKLSASKYRLPERIRLAQSMSVVLPADNSKEIKPIFLIRRYVPINEDKSLDIRDSVYSLDNLTHYPDGNNRFTYRKEFNTGIMDKEIANGMSKYSSNDHGVKEYDFEIKIPENTTGIKSIVTKDGKKITVGALFIPGVYKVKVYYSDFTEEDDFTKAKDAQEINIFADDKNYRSLKDADRAWRDGGMQALKMKFSPDVKRITKEGSTRSR